LSSRSREATLHMHTETCVYPLLPPRDPTARAAPLTAARVAVLGRSQRSSRLSGMTRPQPTVASRAPCTFGSHSVRWNRPRCPILRSLCS